MNTKPEHAREEIGAADETAAATESSEFEALLKAPSSRHASPEARAGQAGEDDAPAVIEADIDGKRVRIVAKDEIVLECGNASITLRRNGRIVIKGSYVETCSEGTNRIKGGQVRIN
jgi:hypothetical protein